MSAVTGNCVQEKVTQQFFPKKSFEDLVFHYTNNSFRFSNKLQMFSHANKLQTSGNKGKGRISKRLQENKARQIFRKTNISYPLIRTHTCTY